MFFDQNLMLHQVDKQMAKKEEVNNELTRDATHETDESGDWGVIIN